MKSLLQHISSTMKKANLPHLIFTTCASVITWITKMYTALIWVFFLAVFLDLVSGMVRGWHTKKFNSKRLRETVVKLYFYLSVLTMVMVMGKFNESVAVLLVPFEWFFISVEVTSIIENGKACNVNFGGKLVDLLMRNFEVKER